MSDIRNKLRINSVSDLHLEFYKAEGIDFPRLSYSEDLDVLVLAGDIITSSRNGVPEDFTDWIIEQGKYAKHVIYIPGNHEYYKGRRDKFARIVKERFKGTNINFLLNDSVVIDGVRFIGTDLFSDHKIGIRKDVELLERELYAKQNAHRISDFKAITAKYNGYKKLNIYIRSQWHQEAKSYILNELNNSKEPTVLITHHGIDKEQLIDYGKGDDLYFLDASDIVDQILETKNPPLYHFSGHNHQFKTGVLRGKLPYLINSRGYFINKSNDFLINDFKSDYLVEIEISG